MTDLAIYPADSSANLAPRALVAANPWVAKSSKLLVGAVAVSTLAHFLLATYVDIDPPQAPRSTTLTTRVAAMPAPPPVSQRPTAAPTPKAKPKPRRAAPPAPSPVAQASEVEAAAPESNETAAESTRATEPERLAGDVDLNQTSTRPENEEVFKENLALATEPKPPEPEPAPKPLTEPPAPTQHARTATLPKTIDLKFWIGFAQDGGYPMSVGGITLRFEHDGGNYKLSMSGKASGLMSFMYPGTLNIVSKGDLTVAGIRPTQLSFERSDRADRNRKIDFDWAAKEMRATNKPPVPLEGPTYDALSFLLQFYFAAPEGDQIEFRVATPSGGIDTYRLKRDRDETLKAPDGERVATQVWRGSRLSREGMAEFWLAPSWHFIPFKVKMTDEKQRTAVFDLEQVAVAKE